MRLDLSEWFLLLALVLVLVVGWLTYTEERKAAMACRRDGGAWVKVGEDMVMWPDGRGGMCPTWQPRMGCVK